jgi:hypothetical protein
MKLFRQLKAFITGIKPCTFETSHGHLYKTQRLGMRDKHHVAICKCSVCGLYTDYNLMTGEFVNEISEINFEETNFAEITQP